MYGYNPYQYIPNTQPNNYVKSEIVQVNGKNGAEALILAPNSSIILADNTKSDRLWFVMTDGAGYKTVKSVIYTFEEEEPKVDMKSVENRISRLEEMINDINSRHAKRKSDEIDGQQTLPGVVVGPIE